MASGGGNGIFRVEGFGEILVHLRELVGSGGLVAGGKGYTQKQGHGYNLVEGFGFHDQR